MAAIGDPSTRITVILDGLPWQGSVHATVMSAAQHGLTPLNNPLTWEIARLFENQRLGTVVFMLKGQVVANPFPP